MIQGFDPVREKFLADLNSLTHRMAVTQGQLSSGLRVSKPSDDPSAVADILRLEFDIGRVQQTVTNLNHAKGEVDFAESSLQGAGTLLDQVQALGVQGANGTQTASQRTILANQVQQVLQQLVDTSRGTFDGTYVFSGDQASQPAYRVNLANPNGVDRLVNAGATKLAQDVNGVSFPYSLTAGQIFDHRNPDDSLAPDNVFAAVNSLRLALANNDQAGITTALTSLKTAQDYLEQQHGFYGAVQNHITNSLDVAQKSADQWKASLSQERDADIAAASTDLASENLTQQAALQSQASVRRGSLFDYLK